MRNTFTERQGAFTLVELMVVVAIIGVLTMIAVPIYVNITAKFRQTACMDNQRVLESCIVQYHASNGVYPDDLELLVQEKLLHEVPACASASDSNGGVISMMLPDHPDQVNCTGGGTKYPHALHPNP